MYYLPALYVVLNTAFCLFLGRCRTKW